MNRRGGDGSSPQAEWGRAVPTPGSRVSCASRCRGVLSMTDRSICWADYERPVREKQVLANGASKRFDLSSRASIADARFPAKFSGNAVLHSYQTKANSSRCTGARSRNDFRIPPQLEHFPTGERARLACCLQRLAAMPRLWLSTLSFLAAADLIGEAPMRTREGACAPQNVCEMQPSCSARWREYVSWQDRELGP
jgi:hypothetical protein